MPGRQAQPGSCGASYHTGVHPGSGQVTVSCPCGVTALVQYGHRHAGCMPGGTSCLVWLPRAAGTWFHRLALAVHLWWLVPGHLPAVDG